MTDDTVKKDTLKISTSGRLSLTKTVDAGKVKQNFTHGRSKTVTVEVRKTRTLGGPPQGAESQRFGGRVEGGDSIRHLTEDERQTRLKVLKMAEAENLTKAAELAERNSRRAQEAADEEETGAPAATEVVRPRRDDGMVVAPLLSGKKLGGVAAPTAAPPKLGIGGKPLVRTEEDEEEEAARTKRVTENKAEKGKPREDRRNSGKITVTQALGGYDERVRSLASMRRQREKVLKKNQGTLSKDQEKIARDVIIPEAITVQELSNRMATRVVDVVKVLMRLGMMVTAAQTIDADTAELVVTEFGHKFKRVSEGDVENVLRYDEEEDASGLQPRPPVVTVMGHVDHGKTSLLDALRKTDVAAKEAGGITQHIGAYQVDLGSGEKVTFLDTPGHEAFTAMRARGAKVTDIVVLVVAADDGIMAQTKEAINHAKAAGVPIIVAVNKIDKPGADASRVLNELMQYELVPEEFGGDIIVVPVSAKQGTNLDKLVESILVQAEILELKANPERDARGVVIESKLDTGRGVVATLLVQKGTLKTGDIVVAGAASGRVRVLTDDKGRALKEAGPGMPVEIQGLSLAPEAGDVFSVVADEKTAREIAEYRERTSRTASQAMAVRTMDQLFGAAKSGVRELPVIIRGDVQGSVEAIAASINKYSGDEVAVKVLHAAVGAISESDITLAKATGAVVIAFNVRASPKAKEMAQRDKVEIRYYSVIYNVVDDIKAALSGLLSPTLKENFIGYAEIRQIFNMSKAGKVAGCYVTEGIVKRGAGVRLLRDDVVIHQGTLKTLKRFKDEVKEVKSGFECGMAFENYEDIREGDMIEAFEVTQEARTV